jgi:acyl phosphate:glycerol-3-phosphate acyltransferase
MISPWVVAGWCLLAYLVGGLPVGWLLVRWQRYGLDLRKFGTGNIGTSNVYRHAGIDVAVVVGPLQFAQGFIPVLAARLAGFPVDALMLIGASAVAGNGWPIYMRFNGGRGVAVATGAVAAVSVAGLIALLMCYAWGAIRGRIALAVLAAFVILPIVVFFFGGPNGWILATGCIAILVLLLLRRLEGLPRDARVYGHFWRRAYQRLVFDERPGRPLMGPRTDPGGGTLRH